MTGFLPTRSRTITLFFCLVVAASAASGVRSAQAPAAAQGPVFSITAIAPDAEKRTVEITFDQPVDQDALQANLRFLPPVRVEWYETQQDPKGLKFTLKADFKYGEKYTVVLPETAVVAGRHYLRKVNTFTMPDLGRSIEFGSERSVMERDSRQMLHVVVRNVDAVLFRGTRVPPILTPLALTTDEKRPASYDAARAMLVKAAKNLLVLGAGDEPAWKPFTAEPLEEKQLFFTAGEKNKDRPFSLPLTFRDKKERGAVMLVRVGDNDTGSAVSSPARLLQITDLGIACKHADDALLVWVTGLRDGLPRKGVQILAFSESVEAFPLGVTDADGILVYRGGQDLAGLAIKPTGEVTRVRGRLDPARVTLLAAVREDDQAFLQLPLNPGPATLVPDGITPIPRAAGGRPRNERAPMIFDQKARRTLTGYLFTDRGVYRPGETVNFKGYAREFDKGAVTSPAGLDTVFQIVNSKGEQVLNKTLKLSAFGTAAGSLQLGASAPTGSYTLTLSPAQTSATPIATRTFEVEIFRQPRHFAEVAFKRETRPDTAYVNQKREQEMLVITMGGTYYAGGPVKHGQIRWKIFHTPAAHDVKGWPEFEFGYMSGEKKELLESGEAVLDEKGQTKIEFPLDREILSGRFGLEVNATVIDFDGRASGETKLFQVRPDYLVGLGRHPETIQGGEGQEVRVSVIDKNGNSIAGEKVLAEIFQQGWSYSRKRNERGDVFWEYQPVWRRMVSTEIALESGGQTVFPFDFAWWGTYLVSVTYRRDGKDYVGATAFQVEGDYYYYEDRERDRERTWEKLNLRADHDAYRPGDKARLYMKARRPVTRYLLTIERDGILDWRVITPKDTMRNVEMIIKETFAPNVYVTMLGITARGDFPVYSGRYDEDAPSFFYGALNIPVRRETGKLLVEVGAEGRKLKAGPGDKVTVDLAVRDGSGTGTEVELAVGVVDESVLALTQYATPVLDELNRFEAPLRVLTEEMRALLLHQTPFELARSEPLTGGGGLDADSEAVTGRKRKRFDPVAYFNPSVLTDAAGKASVTFTVPDTMTTYRVYVVGCDRGSLFGSAQKPLLVTKDFYLEPGLPRFFTKGDRFTFLVAAFNATAESGSVEFTQKSSPNLQLTTAARSFALGATDSARIPVQGEAVAVGEAVVTVYGDFKGRKDAVELPIPVQSGNVIDTELLFGTFKGAAEVSMPLRDVARKLEWAEVGPGEAGALLTISGSPFLRMSGGLKYLLHYPYGCIEQTSSGVIPLVALRGLIKEGLIPGISAEETDKFLKGGIDRLFSMQLEDGSFGYWPGYTNAHPWGTIYAGTALALARESGFAVPDAFSRTTARLADDIMKGVDTDAYRSFAAWILAMDGKLTPDLFSRVSRNFPEQPREAQMALVMAAKRGGLMPDETLQGMARTILAAPWNEKQTVEFYARWREPALALLVGTQLVPGDPLTGAAALRLMGGINPEGFWSSTSDTGWSLLALGRYFGTPAAGGGALKVKVTQKGREAQMLEVDPKSFRTLELDARSFFLDPSIRLEADRAEPLVYKIDVRYPRFDYAKKGYEGGFKVWKEIENTDGSKKIKVGDVLKVTVRMEVRKNLFPSVALRYVVLDDPLPAGLVAINSAFKTEEPVPGKEKTEDDFDYWYWSPDGYYKFVPNFMEIRDDRILAFTDRLWTDHYQFVYYARAVCQGEFILPSTKVQCMYSPEVAGYSPTSIVTVEAR